MTEFDPVVSVLLRIGAGLYLAAMVACLYWIANKLYRWSIAPSAGRLVTSRVRSSELMTGLQGNSNESSERVRRLATESAALAGFGPGPNYPYGGTPSGLHRYGTGRD